MKTYITKSRLEHKTTQLYHCNYIRSYENVYKEHWNLLKYQKLLNVYTLHRYAISFLAMSV